MKTSRKSRARLSGLDAALFSDYGFAGFDTNGLYKQFVKLQLVRAGRNLDGCCRRRDLPREPRNSKISAAGTLFVHFRDPTEIGQTDRSQHDFGRTGRRDVDAFQKELVELQLVRSDRNL